MHKIALFFPKTAAFHGLRFETKKIKHVKHTSKNKIVLYTPYRCKLFLFVNPQAERRAAPEPCTHTLFNNKVRYITYFIIILFFIIAQGPIPFSRVKRKRTQNRVRFLLERETGFGPATSTLARWHSTTESLPRIMLFNKHSTVLSPFFEVFLTSVSRRVHLPS